MSDQTVDNLVFGHSYFKNLVFYVTFLTLPFRDILLIFISLTVPLQIVNVGKWQDQGGGAHLRHPTVVPLTMRLAYLKPCVHISCSFFVEHLTFFC